MGLQIHREQAKLLESKTLGDCERNRGCEQTENMLGCSTHDQPSELWGTKQSDDRANTGAQEDV
jgi:hypothetical protein